MSVTTAINRFIATSVAGLYQGLLSSGLGFQEVANKLIKIGENAHAFRRHDQLHEIGEILSNFPLKQYQYIGRYYLALSLCRNGQASMSDVRPLIEQLAATGPMPYRARALQLLAATYGAERKPEQELYFFADSLKTGASTFLGLRGVALLKAKEGYHKQSLRDLESLYALAHYLPPHIYFDYLNSLAVELGQVGRKYEARNIINHVLASPFAVAYPEWHETAQELKPPNRSFVAVEPAPPGRGKLLSMPVIEHTGPAVQGRPAKILSLEDWKRKMGKDSRSEKLNEKQMVVRMMNLLTGDSVTYAQLSKIMAYVQKVMSEPEEKE